MATREYVDCLYDSIHEEIRQLKQINHHLYTGECSLSGYTREGILVTGLNLVNRNLQKHNLIYKLTNTITNAFYIGKHSTVDPLDGYYGSGIILHEAQLKYGLSSFIKEILFDFEDVNDCYAKEAELMPEISCHQHNPLCYNMKPGGYGGITKEGVQKLLQTKKEHGYKISELTKQRISKSNANKPKSAIHRQHLSDHHRSNKEYTIQFETTLEVIKVWSTCQRIAKQYNIKNYQQLVRDSRRDRFYCGIKILELIDHEWIYYMSLSKTAKIYEDPVTKELVNYMTITRRKAKFPKELQYEVAYCYLIPEFRYKGEVAKNCYYRYNVTYET